MRGYQQRPCHCTPAPGGSDRYSTSMTAGPFCIRKAILIHEPINTDTSGFASATPPLVGCLFSSVFFSFCLLSEKNTVKSVSLSVDQHCARLDGRNNGGSVGGGASATNARFLSWHAPSVAANQAALRPPAERMASALCFWDNQRTILFQFEGSLRSMD